MRHLRQALLRALVASALLALVLFVLVPSWNRWVVVLGALVGLVAGPVALLERYVASRPVSPRACLVTTALAFVLGLTLMGGAYVQWILWQQGTPAAVKAVSQVAALDPESSHPIVLALLSLPAWSLAVATFLQLIRDAPRRLGPIVFVALSGAVVLTGLYLVLFAVLYVPRLAEGYPVPDVVDSTIGAGGVVFAYGVIGGPIVGGVLMGCDAIEARLWPPAAD